MAHRPYSLLAAALVAVLLASPWAATGQITKLVPPDSAAANYFGTSVALDGEWAVLGATGTQSCGPNSGAAYVYRRSATGAWQQHQMLMPSDCHEDHFFGNHVTMSDGWIAVTSNRPYFRESTSNAVYMYALTEDSTWTERQRIEQPDTLRTGPFATALALDGDRLAVTTAGDTGGGTFHGSVYIFRRDDEGTYGLQQRLTGSVSPRQAVLGVSVALDGHTLAVGASTHTRGEPGFVYLFSDKDTRGNQFTERQILRGIQSFFIPIDVDGDRLVIGENRGRHDKSGRVRILERNAGGSWLETAQLRPRVPFADGAFGTLVRVSGDRILAVGYDEQLALEVNIDRIAYAFRFDPSEQAWTLEQVVDVGDTSFASAIDLDGAMALIGHAGDGKAGQAYIVRLR